MMQRYDLSNVVYSQWADPYTLAAQEAEKKEGKTAPITSRYADGGRYGIGKVRMARLNSNGSMVYAGTSDESEESEEEDDDDEEGL